MRRAAAAAAALALGAAAAPAAAQADVRLVRVGAFAQPVYATAPPGDGRLFVVERRGRIRIVRDGRVLHGAFADLRRHVLIRDPSERVDQRGLLSIAFARDYRRSGLLYAMYADRGGRLRVDELRRSAADPRRVDPASRRRVVDLGRASLQHHGGQLQMDRRGLLWISTGMGDDPESSRDLGSPNGKLLRIDPRRQPDGSPYGIPADNPLGGVPDALPEVVASGLRNPWRFSLDERSGLALIGDVGEQQVEEVDALPLRPLRALDFGWPVLEGGQRAGLGSAAGAARPLLTRRHGGSGGWCSVVGGYVVRRGPKALRGRYVYGDVCSGRLRSARIVSATRAVDDRPLSLRVPYLVSFGLDGRGRLHAASLNGVVWRFAAR